jgi:methionyl-tRNA synthetase
MKRCRALEKMAEESYFFRMSKYADALIAKIESDEFKIRPVGRRNQILVGGGGDGWLAHAPSRWLAV